MKVREPEFYCRLIVTWHRFWGMTLRPDPTYHASVRSMVGQNLSSRDVQMAIATLQISGSWEWAYSKGIPEEAWMKCCSVYGMEPAFPQNLGEAARKVIGLLAGRAEGPAAIRFSDREELLAKAQEVYERFAADEVLGAGSVSFLLSCSVERDENLLESGLIRLFSAADLGVLECPQGRPGDLIGLVRSNALTVEQITGVTTEDQRVERREIDSSERSHDV